MARRERQDLALIHLLLAVMVLPGCSSGEAPSGATPAAPEDAGGPGTTSALTEVNERPRFKEIRLDGGTRDEPAFKALERASEIHDPWDADRRIRLDHFERAERVGFVPLTSFEVIADHDHVKADSEKWMGRFLAPEASPYREGARVKRFIHRASAKTLDILRHQLTFEADDGPDRPKVEVALRVFESIDTVWVVVDRVKGKSVLGVAADERPAVLSWMADRVLRRTGMYDRGFMEPLKVEYAWTFLYTSLEEGSWFSTDASQDAQEMDLWALRVDGGIRNGRAFFMGFKKPQLSHGQVWFSVSAKHWFDGKGWRDFEKPRPRPRAP